jgi:hypothetical protein
LRAIESSGVKLRVFEDQRGYFKTDGSSRGSCEIIPKNKKDKSWTKVGQKLGKKVGSFSSLLMVVLKRHI